MEKDTSGWLAKTWNDLFGIAWWLLGCAVELVVFTKWTGVLRSILAVVLRRHLAAIRPAFDASLYARQFDDALRRRRVGRAPLLHYTLLGWREGRAPSATFDPHHFWRRNLALPRTVDPLLLHAAAGDVRAPCHEPVGSSPGGGESGERPAVLTIHHGRGGGSSTFLELYEADRDRAGYRVLRLRAVAGGRRLAVLDDPGETAGLVFDLASDLTELAERCRLQGVAIIVVNHVIDRPNAVFEWIPTLARLIGCEYEVILHDYYALCPRVNMVTGDGRFCDAAPLTVCAKCTAADGSDVEGLDVALWRPRFASFLGGATNITVPSEETARRMAPFLPSKPVSVWEPEDDAAVPAERLPVLARDEPLRVACIGALSVPKGAHVLQALASEALSRREPFEFTVIGDCSNGKALRELGVRVTGFYRAEDVDRLIRQAEPHVVLLPSVWPETWSFVLTVALRHGLPVVVFDLGAPAERLRRLARGYLLPIELAWHPAALLEAFRKLRSQWIAN